MNYLETGLPHTKFSPTKTMFSPPRLIPLCTLGRKYLGLEPIPKKEIDCLTQRLCQPKKPSDPEDHIKYVRPATSGTGRFVGEKRMSSVQIGKMVERLYSRRSTKPQTFADETNDSLDFSNVTNDINSSSDPDDCNRDGQNESSTSIDTFERRYSHVDKLCDSAKSGLKRSHDSTSALRDQIDNSSSCEISKPAKGFNEGPKFERANSVFGVQAEKSPNDNALDRKLCEQPPHNISNMTRSRTPQPRRTILVQRTAVRSSSSSSATVSNQQLARGSGSIKMDSARSPRSKLQKVDDSRLTRPVSTPCQELLIDKVATYNRSLRSQFR